MKQYYLMKKTKTEFFSKRTSFTLCSIRNILVFILLFSLGCNRVCAQQQQTTAYEKKKNELAIQLWKKYGKAVAQAVVGRAEGMSDKEFIAGAEELGKSGAKELVELHGRRSNLIDAMIWYGNELKKAQKLKTATDFNREKEAKAKKEREAYERTDAGVIQRDIKIAFEQWNKKGEFEKQSDYEERLQNQSKNAFAQTCVEQIKNKLRNEKPRMKLQPYNTDNEFFTVNFEINNIEWQSKINIPIANAENFKSNFGWNNFQTRVKYYDWCFVENKLCPTLVTLFDDNNEYDFSLSLQNKSEITYSFDDLGISNPYLKGFIFRYSDAKEMEIRAVREKFVKDSLEIESYNDKLKSAFQDYNQKLLENSYNLEKTVISNYEKISMEEKNGEEVYKTNLRSLEADYDKIKRNLESNFNREYFGAEQFFSTKEEFEKFYIQGKDVMNEEVAKRKEKQEEEIVFNFLKSNSKSIESVDFQKEKKE